MLSAESSWQGKKEFEAEVKVLTQLRHRNIVELVGWCDSNEGLLLVYELMAQGSLDKHLNNPVRILSWQQRYPYWHKQSSTSSIPKIILAFVDTQLLHIVYQEF
jgi:serine/threonine protein kinase